MNRGDLQSALGRAVRARRERLGLRQDELAARSGMRASYLWCIEKGRNAVTLSTLQRVARALGCEPSELLRNAECALGTQEAAE